MRKDVLQEFVEAAQLGQRRYIKERGIRVHVDDTDHVAASRRDVHAFLTSIAARPKKRRRSWWDRPVELATRWKKP